MINDFGDVNYSQNCRNFYVHCPSLTWLVYACVLHCVFMLKTSHRKNTFDMLCDFMWIDINKI